MNHNTEPLKNHLVATNEESIIVYDQSNNYTQVKQLKGHKDYVVCLIKYKDNYIASGSSDKTIKIWELTTGNCIKTLEGHTNTVSCLTELKNGYLASGSNDNSIKIWDENLSCINTLSGHTNWLRCLYTTHNGWLLSGSDDKLIKVWNSDDFFTCLLTLEGHTKSVCCITQLPNNDIVSISSDCKGIINIWGFNQQFQIVKQIQSDSQGLSLCVLPNNMMASAHTDNNVRIWDLLTYECVSVLEGHTDWVFSVILLRDGTLASSAKEIILWEMKDSKVYTEKKKIPDVFCFSLLEI